jgi:hypothetical protein
VERHQRDRMRRKARKIAWINHSDTWNDPNSFWNREQAERHYEKVADNLCACSCEMCRNPRHSDWYSHKTKMTVPERKALERARQQIKEFQEEI